MTRVAPSRGPRLVFVTDSRNADGRYAWRLDAANNRPLGRGVGVHQSLDECRRRLEALRHPAAGEDGADVADALFFEHSAGMWSWHMKRDGEPCAVSTRTYLRRFECRRAATQFVEALSTASPHDAPVRIIRADALGHYGEAFGPADAS